MPRINTAIAEQIRSLSKKELEDIVIKLASENGNYDFLQVNYFNREYGSEDLLEEAKAGIDRLCAKSYKGRSEPAAVGKPDECLPEKDQ
jgi:hypothetical protein